MKKTGWQDPGNDRKLHYQVVINPAGEDLSAGQTRAEKIELWDNISTTNGAIATGDVNKIAEVVRDLAQRDVDEHGLSAGEKRMLTKARAILTSEIALSEKIDEAEAQRLLDVNLGYEPAQPGDDKHHTAEPEEAAADTLARVEAEKKSKKK